jgi:hypothetical protein
LVLLAPRQFSSNCLSNRSFPRWPNENKVNGIFISKVSTSTQLIFPGIQHLIRSLFLHDCLKPEDF